MKPAFGEQPACGPNDVFTAARGRHCGLTSSGRYRFERTIVRSRPYHGTKERSKLLYAAGMDDLERLLDDPVRYLGDHRPTIRRLALSSLAGDPAHCETVARLLDDKEPRVRAEAAEVLGTFGKPALASLLDASGRTDVQIVVEAIASALGEVADSSALPWLIDVARGKHDTVTRETAVASLGAIADPTALPVLLDLVAKGPPHVRRRCVVALTVFDGAEVEAAIRTALTDRNPMVREAAEMVVGRPSTEER